MKANNRKTKNNSKTKNKNNRRPRNRIAIFYKSHGKFIGPYCGITLSKEQLHRMRVEGVLTKLSKYILHSPLQLRRRAV